MGLQRVRHGLVTKQQQQYYPELNIKEVLYMKLQRFKKKIKITLIWKYPAVIRLSNRTEPEPRVTLNIWLLCVANTYQNEGCLPFCQCH